jgi:hypothetical protein
MGAMASAPHSQLRRRTKLGGWTWKTVECSGMARAEIVVGCKKPSILATAIHFMNND